MLVVAPRRLRMGAALLAAALMAGAGVLVVTADWHRPSDPIGSYLLTLAVTSGLLALLYARQPSLQTGELVGSAGATAPAMARRIETFGGLAAAALFFGALSCRGPLRTRRRLEPLSRRLPRRLGGDRPVRRRLRRRSAAGAGRACQESRPRARAFD